MKIQQNCRVELAFSLLGPDDVVYESSEDEGNENLVIEHGAGELPEALTQALEGLEAGSEVEVDIPAGEMFGDHDPENIVSIDRSDLPDDPGLVKGVWIEVMVEDDEQGSSGAFEARIVENDDETVVLDANHPLASKPVKFRAKVVAVSEA